MVLAYAALIGALIGVIKHRSVTYLADIDLRKPWVFLIACALEMFGILGMTSSQEPGLDLRGGVFLAEYALVGLAVWINRGQWAIRLLGLGFALNLAVILPHSGYMPITPEAYAQAGYVRDGRPAPAVGTKLPRAKDIALAREDTILWPLSDIFPIDAPVVRGVYSPGDFIIALAAAWLASGIGVARVNHWGGSRERSRA